MNVQRRDVTFLLLLYISIAKTFRTGFKSYQSCSLGTCINYQSTSQALIAALDEFSTSDCFRLEERKGKTLTEENLKSTRLNINATCANSTSVS